MSHQKPTTQEVVNDLLTIIEKLDSDDSVSYSWLSKESTPVAFPALTYLRFLTDKGYMDVDRVSDTASITDLGLDLLDQPGTLRAVVLEEFADRIDTSADDYKDEAEDVVSLPQTSRAHAYERIEEIGTGGIGTVFIATQKPLNRRVAVKEIREIFNVFAGVQRDDIIARFTKIVHQQAQLDHPNIISLVDLITDTEFPFVVMAYAEKGNLRRLIEAEGRPPLEIALKYFLQILHAFSKAHTTGICHGGIKPENIVLDSSGNALVTDFGISSVADLDTNKGNQVFVGVGTVAYMAPEQFANPNHATVTSDIYSLGILLYEMLTGKMPGRRSPMPSSFYPDIPRKLDDIFDRMSMDDPADRYQSVSEILVEIYTCEQIMQILDKRTGFQFLRDPLTYGTVGLPELESADAEFSANVSATNYQAAPPQEVAPTQQHNPRATIQTLPQDDHQLHKIAAESDLEEHSSATDEDEASAGDKNPKDVLGRLDKYSDMFVEEAIEESNEEVN